MRKKIVFLPYDFDTAIGINNEGALVFSYNLEDIDQTEGGADVFNGQQSVLWKNLRACFFNELRTMYQTLRSNKALSYEKAEQMFEEHQSKWPEAVFNEDAWFKYLAPLVEKGNGAYLSMLQGSKAEQRKWWLYNRFRYMDSKYNAGDSLSDVITLRGYAKSDITVTPYADIYATIKYGSYLVQTRAARNQAYLLACPLDNVNDTEIYIYSASQLASVGDLSGLMVGYANFAFATKLQSLKLGDADTEYSNGNLTELYLGNNELLREIDVRNCPALTQAVDISGCSNIERAYFDGTNITGLSLPNGGILKALHLPASLVNLTLLNQTALTEFVFPASDRLTTLRLENTGTVVDSFSLVESMPINSRIRIIGFSWNQESYGDIETLYDYLDTMRGIDETGGNTEKAQLSGTIHVPALSTDQMRELRSRYADIRFEADAWTYRVRFFHDGELLYTTQVAAGSDATDPVTAGAIITPEKPAEGNTAYVFFGWDKDLTDIHADTDVSSVFIGHNAYTVTFQNYDGTVLLVKKVAEGSTCPDPAVTGEIPTPTKPGDATYVYSFLGWTGGSLINVTSDRILTAAYSQVQSYTIKFNNWDSTTLLTLYLQQNAQIPDPIRTGLLDTPTRPDDASYEYTFSRWNGVNNDGSFPKVNGNKTFTATYTPKLYYRFTFKNYDDTILLTEKHYSGDMVTDPVVDGRIPMPTKEPDENYNYFFWKWNYTFPITASGHVNAVAMYHTDVVHTVTFKNYDNSVLDVQEILDGSDAVNPVTSGRIGTPLRPSTAQYDYTFKGWSRSFKAITADTTVTAQFNATTRRYWVHFMDASEELARTEVQYNAAAMIPIWPDKSGADAGKYFVTGWDPSIMNILAETTTYAVWSPLLQDSWAEIFAAELDGTYSEKYSVGQVKLLDLGDEGKIPMRIVGLDKDELPGGGLAKISWLAMSPINTEINAGFKTADPDARSVSYGFAERSSTTLGTYWQSMNTSSNSNSSCVFTITAGEDTDMTIWAYCSAEDYWDTLCVWVGDELVVNCIGLTTGETKEVVVHLTAGEPVTVTAQYHKDTSQNLGEDAARIRFIADEELTITTARGEFREFGGVSNGWLDYTLRTWLEENILPLIPAEVREKIVTVKKYSAIDNSGGYVESEDKLWAPSKRELCFQATSTESNIETVGCQYDDVFTTDRYGRVSEVLTIRGTPSEGFLRSCVAATTNAYYLTTSGYAQQDAVNRKHRVFFGFCT